MFQIHEIHIDSCSIHSVTGDLITQKATPVQSQWYNRKYIIIEYLIDSVNLFLFFLTPEGKGPTAGLFLYTQPVAYGIL